MPIPFEEADHTAIIVLVDDHMVVDEAWEDYVAELDKAAAEAGVKARLFPVAVTHSSFNFPIADTNFIRLFEVQETESTPAGADTTWLERKARFLIGKLAHELSRLLYHQPRMTEQGVVQSAPPIRMFISHAKADGAEIAEAIRSQINSDTSLKSFFDANDIAPGYRFSDELRAALGESAVICVQTDYYATREWCLWEVIITKREDRPVVVVNAVTDREPRSFPYIGNVPTIRWRFDGEDVKAQIQDILDMTLFEVLGNRFRELLQEKLIKMFDLPAGTIPLGHPPELFTILTIGSDGAQQDHSPEQPRYVVYPDPPLGDDELQLLEDMAPEVQFITPTILPLVQHRIDSGAR